MDRHPQSRRQLFGRGKLTSGRTMALVQVQCGLQLVGWIRRKLGRSDARIEATRQQCDAKHWLRSTQLIVKVTARERDRFTSWR